LVKSAAGAAPAWLFGRRRDAIPPADACQVQLWRATSKAFGPLPSGEGSRFFLCYSPGSSAPLTTSPPCCLAGRGSGRAPCPPQFV